MNLPHGCHLREGRCPVCGETLDRVDDVEGLPVYLYPAERRRRWAVAVVAGWLGSLVDEHAAAGRPDERDACRVNAQVLRDALDGGGA